MNNEFETSDGELMFQGAHIKEVNKMNMDERAEIQVKNAQKATAEAGDYYPQDRYHSNHS